MLSQAHGSDTGVALKALRRRHDGWVLVLDKLTRVASGHYKPQRTWVKGETKILRVVASCRGTDFVASVRAAFAAEHPNYRIEGEELEPWNPEEHTDEPIRPRDFARLVEKCKAFEHRLEELEHTLKRLAQDAVRRRGDTVARSAATNHGAQTEGAGQPATAPRSNGSGAAEPTSADATPAKASGTGDAGVERRASEADVGSGGVGSGGVSSGGVSSGGVSSGDVDSGKAAPASSETDSAKNAPATDGADASNPGSPPSGKEEKQASDAEQAGGADASELAQNPEESAALPPPPDSEPLLATPSPEAYARALSELMDSQVTMKIDESLQSYAPVVHYFTELVDDDGTVLGALVVDLKATVYQGGTLMMLGDDVLAESVASEELHEDLEEGMKEILNVQSRCFNDIEGNPHLRVRGFRRMTDTDLWLRESMHRTTFEDSFGGITWLLSK